MKKKSEKAMKKNNTLIPVLVKKRNSDGKDVYSATFYNDVTKTTFDIYKSAKIRY